MAIKSFTKQPGDRLDYRVQCENWLDGDEIQRVSATFRSNDAGCTIEAVSHFGTDAIVWLSGGRDGELSQITVQIETRGGRIKEVEFRIRIIEE